MDSGGRVGGRERRGQGKEREEGTGEGEEGGRSIYIVRKRETLEETVR